jgi:hypothetical protein
MEPNRTKQTPRTGERKTASTELLREMINVSNNSRLTMDAATMLTNSLNKDEVKELLVWLRHANRQVSNKISLGRRF